MPELSFYGLVAGLGNLQAQLAEIIKTYPSLSRDARWSQMETNLAQMVETYEQKNRAFEEQERSYAREYSLYLH